MRLSSATARIGLIAAGILLLAGCGQATAATPTPTKTPKPTYTATVTMTATTAATPTPAATATPTFTATPVPTATPAGTPTPAPTDTPAPTETPVPTDTPSGPPTATFTPAPPPPTNTPAPTPTPTQPPVQYSGSVIWDAGSAQCAGIQIRKDSTITDKSGSPVNGACVCVQLYDLVIRSNPSGPAGHYDPGHYDISWIHQPPMDVTVNAYVCDCGTKANLNSEVIAIPFQTANCAPGQGGHQSAIVNWVKNW